MRLLQRSLVVLVLLATLVPPAGAQGEGVRFRFAPTDGEVWIREVTDVKNADYGGQRAPLRQETRTRIELRYQRQEDGSWIVIQKPLEASLRVNDQPAPNPALDATVGHELRVHLDEQGRATSVEGFDAFMRKLERVLDPQSYARMRKSADTQGMEAQEKREWDRILQDLRDVELHEGELWAYLDDLSTGQGKVAVSGFVRFDGWTELEGLPAFKITWEYDNQGKAQARASGATRTLSRRDEADPAPGTNLIAGGTLVRVIAPATGMLLYEVKDQWFEMPVQGPPDSTARLEEHHTYRYRRASAP